MLEALLGKTRCTALRGAAGNVVYDGTVTPPCNRKGKDIVMEWGLRIIGFAPRVPQINAYFIPDVDTMWSVPDSDLGWVNRPGVALAIGADPAPMTFWDFSRRASRPSSDIPQGNQCPSSDYLGQRGLIN